MAHTMSAVGIDVAKATLSVCFRSPKGEESALTLRNIETDIRKVLLPRIMGVKGKVVLESTGHYHWLSALMLSEAGQDVRIVNPILAKQYTSANIRKVKTDPLDASGLARMAEVADNLPPPFSLTRQKLIARKKLATLDSMRHGLQALQASMASLREANNILGANLSPAEESLGAAIASLKRALNRLEGEFVRDEKKDEAALADAALLTSIPGVSCFAAHLALHWFDRTIGATAKSWIAYAGLDVSSRESGTWRGRTKLTKRGNGFLRKRLYAAAWGAVMNDAEWKAYYEFVRGKDRKERTHVEALVIIARKIVRLMHAVLQSQKAYDPKRFSYGGRRMIDRGL
jgi:transposase